MSMLKFAGERVFGLHFADSMVLFDPNAAACCQVCRHGSFAVVGFPADII